MLEERKNVCAGKRSENKRRDMRKEKKEEKGLRSIVREKWKRERK
jgi:hypothetical protein